jgi:hypothetical protein
MVAVLTSCLSCLRDTDSFLLHWQERTAFRIRMREMLENTVAAWKVKRLRFLAVELYFQTGTGTQWVSWHRSHVGWGDGWNTKLAILFHLLAKSRMPAALYSLRTLLLQIFWNLGSVKSQRCSRNAIVDQLSEAEFNRTGNVSRSFQMNYFRCFDCTDLDSRLLGHTYLKINYLKYLCPTDIAFRLLECTYFLDEPFHVFIPHWPWFSFVWR